MTSIDQVKIEQTEIDDPVERMLKKTGCSDFHYELQICFYQHQDWRKCQVELKRLKSCMDEYQKREAQSHKN